MHRITQAQTCHTETHTHHTHTPGIHAERQPHTHRHISHTQTHRHVHINTLYTDIPRNKAGYAPLKTHTRTLKCELIGSSRVTKSLLVLRSIISLISSSHFKGDGVLGLPESQVWIRLLNQFADPCPEHDVYFPSRGSLTWLRANSFPRNFDSSLCHVRRRVLARHWLASGRLCVLKCQLHLFTCVCVQG